MFIQNSYRFGDSTVIPLGNIISQYKYQNNVNDFVGSNNGTATDITYAAGLVGQTGVFNGSTSSVDCGNATDLQITSGTLSALIKTGGAGSSYRAILLKSKAYGIFLKDNTLMSYSFKFGVDVNTNVNLADNTWHHVGMTFNSGVNSGTKLFIDGVVRLTSRIDVLDQTLGLKISQNQNIQHFNGNIDCATVWDSILSEDEMLKLATEELAGTDINP